MMMMMKMMMMMMMLMVMYRIDDDDDDVDADDDNNNQECTSACHKQAEHSSVQNSHIPVVHSGGGCTAGDKPGVLHSASD